MHFIQCIRRLYVQVGLACLLASTSVAAQDAASPQEALTAASFSDEAQTTAVATESVADASPVETGAQGGSIAPSIEAHAASPDAVPANDASAYVGRLTGDGAAETSPDEATLRLYGFADFGVRYVDSDNLKPFIGETPSFFLGNVNLYAAADLSERWRSLIEVRFTYLPDGSVDSSFKRVSTSQPDYANIGANVRWGGVSLERAWLEYSFHGLLTVRGGSWLTPVGIWNVDHGTPTIIPTMRPYVVSAALFPVRQTGLELYGSHLFGDTTVGYHATISNGRGGIASYGDLDRNKALGARAYVGLGLGDSTLTFGYSLYVGKSTESNLKTSLAGVEPDVTLQYDELSMAADLLWKWGGLHLQGEFFSQQVRYTRAGAERPLLPGPNGGVLPDYHKTGGYFVLGYRFAEIPIMPYIETDVLLNGGWEILQPFAPNKVFTYVFGINYRPIPTVTLKAQYSRLVFVSVQGKSDSFNAADLVGAWSF